MICANGVCGSNCPAGSTFCARSSTENSCISQSLFHLAIKDKNCIECSPEYCPTKDFGDNYFHEDRCLTTDNSNKLHTENHCSQCNDKCRETYKCLPQASGEYKCSCPSGLTECNHQCLDLAQLHRVDCNTCEVGWSDCNGKAEDGCEAHVVDDKENCGLCNINCEQNLSDRHVSNIMCIKGECQFTSCQTGYGNCDSRQSNGCETNLTSDAKNCGKCGYDCNEGYNSEYFSCKNAQCCIKDGYTTYEKEICCNKRYRRWSSYYSSYTYKCDSKKPNDGNNWEEVPQ